LSIQSAQWGSILSLWLILILLHLPWEAPLPDSKEILLIYSHFTSFFIILLPIPEIMCMFFSIPKHILACKHI
jgi:hypothetical protein